MVNSTDVSALLVRVHGLLGASGLKNGELSEGSFAKSLGDELQLTASTPISAPKSGEPHEKGKVPPAKSEISVETTSESHEATESAVSVESPINESVQTPQLSTSDDLVGEVRQRVEGKVQQLGGDEAMPLTKEVEKQDPAISKMDVTESKIKTSKPHKEKSDDEGYGAPAAISKEPIEPSGSGIAVSVAATSIAVPQLNAQPVATSRAVNKDIAEPLRDRPLADRESRGIRAVSSSAEEGIVIDAGAKKTGRAMWKSQSASIGRDQVEEPAPAKTIDGDAKSVKEDRSHEADSQVAAHQSVSVLAVPAAMTAEQVHKVSSNAPTAVEGRERIATSTDRGFLEVRSSEISVPDRAIVSTPSSLEVGIANGSHGWIRVRAELTDAGTVSAAVSSTTSSGTQMLHRDLPALSSFLEREQVPVSSLVVHQTESSGLPADSAGGGAQGGQHMQQGDARQPRQEVPLNAEEALAPDGLMELHGNEGLQAGGGWFSVRA